ncbi:MAG: glutaredoxin [Magnetovibrio sp.]|nr:glutaredoxin [Magnetovibrio sp.]
MKLVRWLLGRLILAVNFLTSPKPIVREQQEQEAIDAITANMSLYQFNACPFCVKVRRQLKKHALNIELRDAQNNVAFKEELTIEGGKHKVPCLRIENGPQNVKWLYESSDIISFLEAEFGLASS